MTTPPPREREILAYFEAKADRYDEVDEQVYWRLSDTLLWDALSQVCREQLGGRPRFLDAGGGTGRWSLRIAEEFQDASGTILDLSADMLRVAESKLRDRGLADRVACVRGDVERLPDPLGPSSVDLVLMFHNVLGFLTDAEAAFRRLASVLRPGGRAVVVAPNRFHGAYFNIARGRLDEARRVLAEGRGRFTDDMPDIAFFTAAELRDAATAVGWEDVRVTGFPRLVYPGVPETRIEGSTASLETLLGAREGFESVLELERAAARLGPAADRGNNLLLVASAPAA